MSRFMGFDFHEDAEETSKITEEAGMFDSEPDHKNSEGRTIEEASRHMRKEHSMSMDNLLDAFFQLAKDEKTGIGQAVRQSPSGMLAIPALIMQVWDKAVEMKGEKE